MKLKYTNSANENHYDYIVIGAGILGSSTAYQLSQTVKNAKILLLEQFSALHSRGSSHGNSRIIRYTYEDAMYSRMGIESLAKWKQLQKLYPHNDSLYVNTGTLDFGRASNPDLQKVVQVVKKNNVEHEIYNASELRAKFPALAKSFAVTEDYLGVYQKDGGSLNAVECVRMFQYLAQHNGGVHFHDNETVIQVMSLDSSEDKLYAVRTNNNIYVTKKVIVCVGSWTSQFVNNHILLHNDGRVNEVKQRPIIQHLQPQQMSYAFFDVKHDLKTFEKDAFPIWIHWGQHFHGETLEQKKFLEAVEDKTELAYYGFPTLPCENYGYVKAGVHFAVKEDYLTNPNNRTFVMPDAKKSLLSNFMEKVFSLKYENPEEPQQMHTCLYTVTPDHDFIIDYHPSDSNIVIASGCSGHLFKFAPVLGSFISGLATVEQQQYGSEERTRFKINKDYSQLASKL